MFDKLFLELKEVLRTTEFACHGLKENGKRLNPIYKNDTDKIGQENWKKFHGLNPIYINENDILAEIVRYKKSIFSNDLIKENRNAPCFTYFGIRSIYVVPLLADNEVVAFIVMPILNEVYDWTEEKRYKCEKIISKYNDEIIETVMLSEK